MRTNRLLMVFLTLLLAPLCSGERDPIQEIASQLPVCGMKCILSSVTTSVCGTLDNTTCLCTNGDFRGAVLGCVQRNCTVLEAIGTVRVQADLCQTPSRSRKKDLLGVLAIEIPAFLSVLLRLYSRWYITCSFELDDFLMLVVAALYIPFEILGQIAGVAAFGVDIWNVDTETVSYGLKLFYATESFYLAIIALTKISVLCFYLRVFPNQGFRRLTYLVMAWVAASSVILIFLQIFQCIPLNYSWEGWKDEQGRAHKCLHINALAFTAAGFSIAQDLVILVLPLPLLARLQTAWRVKLGVMFMFSLGVFVLITSCVRLRSIVLFARSTNLTWDYTETMIWTGLECAVSMIVTSLPAIRALISRASPGAFGSITRSHNSFRAANRKDIIRHLPSPSATTAGARSPMAAGRRRDFEYDSLYSEELADMRRQRFIG